MMMMTMERRRLQHVDAFLWWFNSNQRSDVRWQRQHPTLSSSATCDQWRFALWHSCVPTTVCYQSLVCWE